ncbi:hypothetical protein [Nocardioides sp.]|uniref:hypothetical protein n=1 Tax=Nocardioides sp. TaxID=35761 RepID=UPI00286CD15B|nr:hypothetical protein [Nocardioides sp.]
MTLSTSFEGDPESCWRTAERLEGLAVAVEDARGFVATQATSSSDDFAGWAADAYRLSAGRLHGQAQRCGSACRELAVALTAFGTSLDKVRLALRRTRELARQHLVVEGEEILHPGPYADDGQRRTFALVEETLHLARQVEHQAHRDWQAALAEHAGTAPVPVEVPLPGAAPAQPAPAVPPLPDPAEPVRPAPDDPPPADPPDVTLPDTSPVVAAAAAAAGAAAAGVLTRPPRASRPVDLTLVAPVDDDWSSATPVPPVAPIPWEVPDGPR